MFGLFFFILLDPGSVVLELGFAEFQVTPSSENEEEDRGYDDSPEEVISIES